jgi:hypothetical protein
VQRQPQEEAVPPPTRLEKVHPSEKKTESPSTAETELPALPEEPPSAPERKGEEKRVGATRPSRARPMDGPAKQGQPGSETVRGPSRAPSATPQAERPVAPGVARGAAVPAPAPVKPEPAAGGQDRTALDESPPPIGTCPSCTYQNQPENSYCNVCGRLLPQTARQHAVGAPTLRHCAGCGHGNPKENRFCHHCGRPLSALAGEVAEKASSPS